MAAKYTQQLLSVIKSLTDQDDYETRLLLDEKVNRILTATEGNLVSFDSDGNIQDSTFSVATLTEGTMMLDAILPVFRESFTNPYTDSTDTSLVEQVLAKILHKENSETDYWKVTSASVNDATNEVTFTLTLDQTTETYVASTMDVAFTVTTKADSSDTEQNSAITFGELATVFDGNGVDANFTNLLDLKISNTGLSITYTSGTYTIANIVEGNHILFELSNSTVNSVIRVTSAESDTTPEPIPTYYAEWQVPSGFTDFGNSAPFRKEVLNRNEDIEIESVTPSENNMIFALGDGTTKTVKGLDIIGSEWYLINDDGSDGAVMYSRYNFTQMANATSLTKEQIAQKFMNGEDFLELMCLTLDDSLKKKNANLECSYIASSHSIRFTPTDETSGFYGIAVNYLSIFLRGLTNPYTNNQEIGHNAVYLEILNPYANTDGIKFSFTID